MPFVGMVYVTIGNKDFSGEHPSPHVKISPPLVYDHFPVRAPEQPVGALIFTLAGKPTRTGQASASSIVDFVGGNVVVCMSGNILTMEDPSIMSRGWKWVDAGDDGDVVDSALAWYLTGVCIACGVSPR